MIQSCAKEVCLYADFCSKGQLQIALDADFTPRKITKEITWGYQLEHKCACNQVISAVFNGQSF